MSELSMMVTITERSKLTTVLSFYRERQVPVQFISLALGTASNETLNYLGLERSDKCVFASFVTDEKWEELRRGLRRELQIDMPGMGIAFTVPLSSIGGRRELQFLTEHQNYQKGEESTMKDTKYELLVVIANHGYSDLIMDAARGAGAAGVALFGANYLFDGHVIGMFIFPSIIALIVGFIGLRYGSDSPESYGLGKAEELFGEEISEEDKETESTDMTKWQIFVEYVLKNKVIWLLCFANIFLYVVRIGIDQWSTVYAFQELKLSKAVAIQGFTLFEAGALVGTLLWGWLSDLANGRRGLVACIALALIIATLGVYQHASNEYIYLASLFALGFLVFGPQLLIGVAAVGFVPKKAIGAADGIKGTFAYLIGDSFAKLGLGMIADGTPVFGLTGWAGTFAALDIAAIGCICLMAIVAVMEERKIRREKKIQQLTVA